MKHIKAKAGALLRASSVSERLLGACPHIEMWDFKRMNVSNHQGLAVLLPHALGVRLEDRLLAVTGRGLTAAHISASQLVIEGEIQGISLQPLDWRPPAPPTERPTNMESLNQESTA